MKEISRLSLAFAAMTCAIAFAAGSDVDIHVVAKRADASQPRNEDGGSRTISKEHWDYEVSVENSSFKTMPQIDVRYMIFYKNGGARVESAGATKASKRLLLHRCARAAPEKNIHDEFGGAKQIAFDRSLVLLRR